MMQSALAFSSSCVPVESEFQNRCEGKPGQVETSIRYNEPANSICQLPPPQRAHANLGCNLIEIFVFQFDSSGKFCLRLCMGYRVHATVQVAHALLAAKSTQILGKGFCLVEKTSLRGRRGGEDKCCE